MREQTRDAEERLDKYHGTMEMKAVAQLLKALLTETRDELENQRDSTRASELRGTAKAYRGLLQRIEVKSDPR